MPRLSVATKVFSVIKILGNSQLLDLEPSSLTIRVQNSCDSGVDMSFVIHVALSGNTRGSNVNASSGMKGILFEPLWAQMMTMSLMMTTTCTTL